MKRKKHNISEIIAPMFIITMQLDLIIAKLLKENFKISLSDFKILRAIHVLNSSNQLDIALFNHVTEAAVSKRIKFLLQEGLVEKKVNPNDKRKLILSLSTKGKGLVTELQVIVMKQTKLILKGFGIQEQKELKKYLITIMEMVIRHSPNRGSLARSKHPIVKKIKI